MALTIDILEAAIQVRLHLLELRLHEDLETVSHSSDFVEIDLHFLVAAYQTHQVKLVELHKLFEKASFSDGWEAFPETE